MGKKLGSVLVLGVLLLMTLAGHKETFYPPKYSDQVMETVYTDDLSLLEESDRMSRQYAYREGKVYYRRYHEDSFEATSYTYENYSYLPVFGVEKEMVCIDREGVQTALFTDKGQGDFLSDRRSVLYDRFRCLFRRHGRP